MCALVGAGAGCWFSTADPGSPAQNQQDVGAAPAGGPALVSVSGQSPRARPRAQDAEAGTEGPDTDTDTAAQRPASNGWISSQTSPAIDAAATVAGADASWLSRARDEALRREFWPSTGQAEALANAQVLGMEATAGIPAGAFDEPVLQAPNRPQGFRSYFLNEAVVVVPRRAAPDAAPTWALSMKTRRVGRQYGDEDEDDARTPWGRDQQDDRVQYLHDGYVERFDNRADGLEHSFEVFERPDGQGELVVTVAFAGLVANVENDTGVTLVPTSGGAAVLRYHSLRVWDAAGESLPTRTRGGGGGSVVALVVDDAHAVYPLIIDPTLSATGGWSAESNQEGARFGASVSGVGDVNGDGYADVVVGAPYYYNGDDREGRAYLYAGGPSGLGDEPAWMYTSDFEYGLFGASVGGAGDVNGDGYADVIVGAPGYNRRGAAFVYTGGPAGLTAVPTWSVGGDHGDAFFGVSVSGAGDVNGDGYSDVIVGESRYYNDDDYQGRALLYGGGPSGLGGAPAWTAEGQHLRGFLGASVSGAGDVNADGYSDVIIGEPGYANAQSSEGRALLYTGGPGGLGVAPAWTTESDVAGARFGASVSAAGDFNGDSFADFVVGAPGYDNGHGLTGRAFAFTGGPAGPSAAAAWTASQSDQETASFGASVGGAGDVNRDGYSDVIVGAPGFGHNGEGGVFVYVGGPAGLSATPAWSATGGQDEAGLGVSVSGAGDVNGDGCADVLAGASFFDNGQSDEGRAFLYTGGPSGLRSTASWLATTDQAAKFGYSVSGAGDVNADGYADVIVGAPYYTNGQSREGRAYVYLGSSTGLSSTASWTAESDQAWARFGGSVSGAGDVNADGYDDVIVGSDGSGAYLYLGNASGVDDAPAWSDNPDGSSSLSVSDAGDVDGDGYADVIVGAQNYVNGQANVGAAFVYLGGPTGLSPTPAWSAEGDQSADYFGESVSGAGDVNGDGFADVIVGASGWDGDSSVGGAAFVYLGGPTGLSPTRAWSANEHQLEGFWQEDYGCSVSGAGDVNGDGYDDVIVGAKNQSDHEVQYTGAAFVYLGGPTGLSPTPAWSGKGDRYDYYGSSVSGAGDVNGDGYDDIIVGVAWYDHEDMDEGAAFVYLGGPTGLGGVEAWRGEGNRSWVYIGDAVSGAGDVDADGFADVIVGAQWYEDDEVWNSGAAFVFSSAARATPVVPYAASQWNHAYDRRAGRGVALSNGITLEVKTPSFSTGYARGKLQWEIKPLGTGFTGTGLSEQTSWQVITSGPQTFVATLTQSPPGNLRPGSFRWRVRLKFDPVGASMMPWRALSNTGWLTPQWHDGGGGADFRFEVTHCDVDSDCDDSNDCNGMETCVGNLCQPGTPLSDGAACDNGLFCSVGDTCSATHCVAGSPRDCSAQDDACNVGVCNDTANACEAVSRPLGTACDDGVFCSAGDYCIQGACTGNTGQPDCSWASDACNVGVCNGATDQCEASPDAAANGSSCGDDYCTVGRTCTDGACGGGSPRDCSYLANACNDASCNEADDRCAQTPKAGTPACDDGLFCTEGDTCQAGACVAGPVRDCNAADDTCNDGVCDEGADACVGQPKADGTACDDSTYCTVADSCTAGACAGTARDCSGIGNPCNDGVCSEANTRCELSAKVDGTGCDDGLYVID